MSIEVKEVVKIFGEQKAVDSISFSVQKGEILGFLGPNGAGKSTTMKMIIGFISPSSGSIEVCGYNVVNNPLQVKSKIGYLPENNPLYLDMYITEYLAFTGSIYGFKGDILASKIESMIDLTGLQKERIKKIGQLSKGYRQRVGLAAALIHDPEVLILDEPTTGLDPNQIVEIRNLIKSVGKNKTVVFSSHIMQEVEQVCDKVLIINSGKIAAYNAVSEVTKSVISKDYKLIVSFSESINKLLLETIPEVEKVEEKGNNTYEVISKEKDVRQDVFKIITQNGWNLLEMKSEEISLEKAFQKLTK
jgi:ABC-2 type transport system ATP-binding protein